MNNNTFEAILRILLSFMVIDNNIDKNEKEVIITFLKSKFWDNINSDIVNLAKYKGKLTFENFWIDAKIVYNDASFFEGDRFDVLKLISNLIKSDNLIHDKEIMLFEMLLENWNIPKTKMTELWIQKSLWSKFFGK